MPRRIPFEDPDRCLWVVGSKTGPLLRLQVGPSFYGHVPVFLEQLEAVLAGELAAVTFADEEHSFAFSWRLVDLVVEYEGPKLVIVDSIPRHRRTS